MLGHKGTLMTRSSDLIHHIDCTDEALSPPVLNQVLLAEPHDVQVLLPVAEDAAPAI